MTMTNRIDCEYNFNLSKEGNSWCVCNWHKCNQRENENCKDYQARPLKKIPIKKEEVNAGEEENQLRTRWEH